MEIKPIADTLFCGYNFIISIIFFNSILRNYSFYFIWVIQFYIKQVYFLPAFLIRKTDEIFDTQLNCKTNSSFSMYGAAVFFTISISWEKESAVPVLLMITCCYRLWKYRRSLWIPANSTPSASTIHNAMPSRSQGNIYSVFAPVNPILDNVENIIALKTPMLIR